MDIKMSHKQKIRCLKPLDEEMQKKQDELREKMNLFIKENSGLIFDAAAVEIIVISMPV